MAEIQGDISLILSGAPVIVPGCNIAITQPKVKDVCAFGEDKFFTSLFFFTKAEKVAEEIKMGNSALEYLSDFQILMIILEEEAHIKDDLASFFELICPSYIVQFDAGSINFKIEEDGGIKGQLNPMTFPMFQTMLGQLFVPSSINSDQEPEYNPANERAAEIAAKLKAGREKVKELKAEESGGGDNFIFGTFASVLAIGLGVDINVYFNYTPFQLFDAYIRYGKKRAYDLYQRVSTMPLMDASKMDAPDEWTDSLYKL